MKEPKKVVVGGRTFEIRGMRPTRAILLDKRVAMLLIPVLSGLDLSGGVASLLNASIDMAALTNGIVKGFGSLPDEEYLDLVTKLLSSTIYLPDGGAPIEINSSEAIDQVFADGITDIYPLMIEVMRYLDFSPFVLLTSGERIRKTLGSAGVESPDERTGSGSGKSGN